MDHITYQLKHFKEWRDACTVKRANLYTEMRMIKATGEPQKTPAVEGAEAWNLIRVQARRRVSGEPVMQPTGSCHRVMKDDTVYGKLTQYRKAVTIYSYSSKEVQ